MHTCAFLIHWMTPVTNVATKKTERAIRGIMTELGMPDEHVGDGGMCQ